MSKHKRKAQAIRCPCGQGDILIQKETWDVAVFPALVKKGKFLLGNKQEDEDIQSQVSYTIICDTCNMAQIEDSINDVIKTINALLKSDSCEYPRQQNRSNTERKKSPLCILERSEIKDEISKKSAQVSLL